VARVELLLLAVQVVPEAMAPLLPDHSVETLPVQLA
jgi:hypothetical protein